jgi:hypothetical protein
MGRQDSIFWLITALILVAIPLSACIDFIFISSYSFGKYLSICLFEGIILYVGIVIGMAISEVKE